MDQPEQQDRDLAGEMGVSSERVGPTGPGQVGASGTRDVSEDAPSLEQEPDDDTAPEGLPPKAGYPSLNPRSAEHPYRPPGS